MAETEEAILNHFDSLWFEKSIFTKNPSISPPKTKNPDHEILEKQDPVDQFEELKLSHIYTTLHVRSLSCDQFLKTIDTSSYGSDSDSPKSVLIPEQRLQTILSGKEVEEFSEKKPKIKTEHVKKRKQRIKNGAILSSKSLSELEFEELKGFMDLGFVFSEEDHKDSSLVSIIPGLQRLGRTKSVETEQLNNDVEDEDEDDDNKNGVDDVISRPYLSEAWDVMEKQREVEVKNYPMMNWKIPDVVTEIDMKDHLRFWAHTVASTVR